MRWFGWWFALALVGACTGSGGGGDTGGLPSGQCREDGDCANGESCFSPAEDNCPVEQTCDAASCGSGSVCTPADPAFDSCADAVCRPICSSDADCRVGAETCDPVGGACVPVSCDAGYACAAHETCTPGAPLHGCVRDACAADADCGGGVCVEGGCFDVAGFCSFAEVN